MVNFFDCGPLSTWPDQVSNLFGFGRGAQIYKNWTSDGGDNWDDAAKSGKNAHLIVIMRVRIPQKIGMIELTNLPTTYLKTSY